MKEQCFPALSQKNGQILFVPCLLLKWLGSNGEMTAKCFSVYEAKGLDGALWDSYAPRDLGASRMIHMKVEMTISQI